VIWRYCLAEVVDPAGRGIRRTPTSVPFVHHQFGRTWPIHHGVRLRFSVNTAAREQWVYFLCFALCCVMFFAVLFCSRGNGPNIVVNHPTTI